MVTNRVNSNWVEDKENSSVYIPEIKRILGYYLIGEAPVEEDQERNTDLIVLRMEPIRIACRIRSPKTDKNGFSYYDKWGHQFTIRSSRPSGIKTELTKIIEGYGDYFFYGHGTNENQLLAWGLGKLNIFRLWFNRELVRLKGNLPGQQCKNEDNSSAFRAFCWADLPEEFIVAKHNIPTDESELTVNTF